MPSNSREILATTGKLSLYDLPVEEESSSFEFSDGMEKRSLSIEEDRKTDEQGSRKSPELSQSSGSPVTFPTVSPDRSLNEASWKSEPYLNTSWRDEDAADDMSVASGYSYASYDTTATSESVQDIISRLQSETDRRRRRLLRRRSSRRTGDALQKYSKSKSQRADPKLGFTVEIKE